MEGSICVAEMFASHMARSSSHHIAGKTSLSTAKVRRAAANTKLSWSIGEELTTSQLQPLYMTSTVLGASYGLVASIHCVRISATNAARLSSMMAGVIVTSSMTFFTNASILFVTRSSETCDIALPIIIRPTSEELKTHLDFALDILPHPPDNRPPCRQRRLEG